MQRCAFTPYEGKKPYIFVSYAHKDSNRVFPILEELDRRGYRVWYDDGIAPGSEWPENIAQHLDGCSLTLAFISPASIASANCRREVTFALSKRKPFLGILLEPTEMSLGMEMQLSAQQCIMKYTYQSEEAFFAKVCSCPDTQPCLGQPKAAPAPATPTSAPVIKPSQEKKPMNKKLVGIIAGAAAALVVAIGLIAIVSGGNDQPDNNLDKGSAPSTSSTPSTSTTAPTTTAGEPEQTNPSESETQTPEPTGVTDELYLYYANQAITAEDIAYISQQTELVMLELSDCVIQAGVLDRLKLANTVTDVTITDCQGVTNLKCLASLENLENLNLEGSDVTDGALSPLKTKVLWNLNLSDNAQFSDLSLFAECTEIEEISFEGTAVASVECLKNMTELKIVHGSYSQVKDITPLANLTELQELHFAGCGIESVDSVFYSLYLEVLDISFNQLSDLKAFEYCTTLYTVKAAYNDLDSTYPLSKSAEYLQILDLSGNTKLNSNNVSFLKDCLYMKELYLDGLSLFDLDMLENMQELQKLSAISCYVSDLFGLRNTVARLTYLNLADNSLSDVSVLSGLTCYGMRLDLSYNTTLTDVSCLPTENPYEVLNLTLEYLDMSTVPNVEGTHLVMIFQHGMEENPWLKTDPFDNYTLVGCPMDQLVKMENLLGRNEVEAVTEMVDYVAILCDLLPECVYYQILLENAKAN